MDRGLGKHAVVWELLATRSSKLQDLNDAETRRWARARDYRNEQRRIAEQSKASHEQRSDAEQRSYCRSNQDLPEAVPASRGIPGSSVVICCCMAPPMLPPSPLVSAVALRQVGKMFLDLHSSSDFRSGGVLAAIRISLAFPVRRDFKVDL